MAGPAILAEAGRALAIAWPADYAAVLAEHDGVQGDVGEWLLVLWPAEELVERNTGDHMEFFPGLVLVGGDGAGEALALDRETGEVLLVPWVGGPEDWLVLGATLGEALARMERDAVFEAPRRAARAPRGGEK
jgi:hypothetical protein